MSPHENSAYSDDEKKQLLALARHSIKAALEGEPAPDHSKLPAKLQAIQSCFVTLHTASDQLRGCVGNIGEFEPLAANVAHNAANAAFNDSRFQQVSSVAELDSLHIEISVLTPAEPIASWRDFRVGEHGVILRALGRSAVFLPQVAPEQGWDAETTLSHLAMKAGLPHDAWRGPNAKFDIFKAIVFGEKGLGIHK